MLFGSTNKIEINVNLTDQQIDHVSFLIFTHGWSFYIYQNIPAHLLLGTTLWFLVSLLWHGGTNVEHHKFITVTWPHPFQQL